MAKKTQSKQVEKMDSEILRQIEIAALILADQGYYSMADLEERFGKSHQTINRDTAKLRAMGIDIHSSKGQFFIYNDKRLDAKLLNQLVSTYIALCNTDAIRNFGTIKDRFKEKTLIMFVRLMGAIKSRKMLRMKYGYNKYGEPVEHEIVPLRLIRNYRTLFLVALDTDKIKFFLIEKILDVEFTPRGVPKESLPDLEDLFRHSWGIFTGGEVHKVKLKFAKKYEDYVSNKILMENQKITEDISDNSIILEMDVKLSYEFISWVVGWGGEVEVLAPKKLKDEVIKRARDIVAKYK